MSDRNRIFGIFAALFAGIIWGFLGPFVRGLDEAGITPLQLTHLRYVVATVILGVYLLVFHRDRFRIDRRTLVMVIAMGVFGTAMNSTCYFGSITLISLSLSTVLQYISPFIVVVFSVPLFGERMTLKKAVAVMIAFLGCILCTGLLTDPGTMNLTGILLGTMSGFCFAFYTLGSKDLARHSVHPVTVLFYTSLICCLVLLPFSDYPSIITSVNSSDSVIPLVIATGVLLTLLPFGLYNYAMGKIEAGLAAIITYIEPLTSTLVGLVFYSEAVTLEIAVGIIIILVAVFMVNRNGDVKIDVEK